MIYKLIEYLGSGHGLKDIGFIIFDRDEMPVIHQSKFLREPDLFYALLCQILLKSVKFVKRAGNLFHNSASTEIPISSPDSS
jgi:hypothetical protein